jgi:hypothetical protein
MNSVEARQLLARQICFWKDGDYKQVEHNSAENRVRILADSHDRTGSSKEIFCSNPAAVTLGTGRMLVQHHFFLDFTFYRLYTSMSCNKRPLHFKSMKNGKGE